MTVDGTLTAQQLVDDILVSGSTCVETANHVIVTGTDFGSFNGVGAFDATGTNFPFQSGIVLTSGDLNGVPGPNLDLNSDGDSGWPGDADLELYTTATSTNNASYIEFDFTPNVTELNFDFIMASEEYEEGFECTFSDAFAFILTDQATGDVQNLAVLPGTNIPIEVTNIRPEVIGQCPAVNEEFFAQYNFEPVANPNVTTVPAAEADIDYNGQTVVLTASGTVIPGNTYTIKMVVADESDSAWDMAVFLNAGSFNIGNVDIANDVDGTIEGCEGEEITLTTEVTGIDPNEVTIEWFFNGDLIPGENDLNITVTEAGEYTVTVTAGDCGTSDSVVVTFVPGPEIELGDDIQACILPDDDIVLDATPSNYDVSEVTFEWYLDGTLLTGETNATLIPSQTGTYEVNVTVGSCTAVDTIVIAPANDIDFDLGEDTTSCFFEAIVLDATPSNYDLDDASFEWSVDGEVIAGETDPILEVLDPGTYTVSVMVGECTVTDTIVISLTDLTLDLGEDFDSCFEDGEILFAEVGNLDPEALTFEWTFNGEVIDGEDDQTLEVFEPGDYGVNITYGSCSASDTQTVSLSSDLEVTILEGDFESCPGAEFTLVAESSDPNVTYKWYLNGDLIEGETSNTLVASIPENSVGPQRFRVKVRRGLCFVNEIARVSLYRNSRCVLPEGLSPSGSPGLNERFDLTFLAERTGIESFRVFNRQGLIVYEKDNYVNEWKGQSDDNKKMPTGTYYYVIIFDGEDPIFGTEKSGWVYINQDEN